MKFITVVDEPKIDEILATGYLKDNCMFEMDEVGIGIVSEILSDLVLPSNSVVNGYCIDGKDGDLSNLWSEYLKSLPVKTGDVIMQFSVNEDECVYCDFNQFMEFSYLGNSEFIKDIVTYRFDKTKVAFVQQLSSREFEKAFIVTDGWQNDNLVVPGAGNKLVTGISGLKSIKDSNVWR